MVGFGGAEIEGTAVPRSRLSGVALNVSEAGAAKVGRIEGCPEAKRRSPVSGSSSALVKQPCRSDIARAQAGVPACQ